MGHRQYPIAMGYLTLATIAIDRHFPGPIVIAIGIGSHDRKPIIGNDNY